MSDPPSRRQFFKRAASQALQGALSLASGRRTPIADLFTEQFREARDRAQLDREAFARRLRQEVDEDTAAQVSGAQIARWEAGYDRIPAAVLVHAQVLSWAIADERGESPPNVDPPVLDWSPRVRSLNRLKDHIEACRECNTSASLVGLEELPDSQVLCPVAQELRSVYLEAPLFEDQ